MYDAASDPFLLHRKNQEQSHIEANAGNNHPMASLVTVELNITELCNRTCSFCPRTDPAVYPNRNLNMSEETAEKVAHDLALIGYRGRISFSGFGEPLLNKRAAALIAVFRRHLPGNTIEMNTNGDPLTVASIRALFEAGLTFLYINLYDDAEQRRRFEATLAEAGIAPARYRLRDHWVGANDDFGLNLNNRSGMVRIEQVKARREPGELAGTPCFYPFYKMLVDWNGDVLFCANDWGRQIVVGNVLRQRVDEVWLSPAMSEVRARLAKGDRSVAPCDACNVVGTLHGRSSFDLLTAHTHGR